MVYELNGLSEIAISLVICTRNRSKYLSEMLNSLKRLNASPNAFEIVIVNNGSSDDTANLLAAFLDTFEGNIRVVDEPRAGLSIARNTGWRLATGKYIAFTDDDCYPAADLLEATIASFEKYGADYLGGRVLLHDPDDAPVTIQLREDLVFLEPGGFIEAGLIHGANFCMKRTLLESLGGFDPLFGAGGRLRSGEDTDIMIRASANGFKGVYDPTLVVSHHHRRRTQDEVAGLYRSYAYGRGALTAKAMTDKKTRKLYGKRAYWRCRSFIRDGQWSELTGEMRGAIDYFLHR